MFRIHHGFTLALVCITVAILGCNRSPEAKKARHLERGDNYFSQQQYKEAVIEYRNVLRLESTDTHAIQRLGLAYYQLGEHGQSVPFLLKTRELVPGNLDARLKLGTLYLASRKSEEARDEARFVLEQDPKSFEALLLWVGAANTPEEVDEAMARLEIARADFGEQAKLYLALGTLYLRKQNLEAAERSFKEALTKDPRSIEAHTLLGNFYLAQRDTTQAEREFKAAADIAPVGSPTRVTLADFYLLLHKPEEAKKILAEITKSAPDFLPAWRRTAQIALSEKTYAESLKAIEVVLQKNPEDLEGYLLRGQARLALGETTAAIADFQRVLKSEPKSAAAHYQLALAQVQTGNVQQAKTELQEVVASNANFAEARLLLADLNLRTGVVQSAIKDLEQFIEQQPKLPRAYVLLGSAYLAKKDAVKATETYRQFSLLTPKNPQGPYLVGIGLRAQGKVPEARKAFAEALTLAPGFVEPLAQLVSVDFAEKKSVAALERVQKQMALAPQSAGLQTLLGQIYLAHGEREQAEAAYLKAIELDNQLFAPYIALSGLYAATKRYDEALARLAQALQVNAKNLGAHMLVGMIHEQRGAIPQAQAAYGKVLELNPRFGPAANNLAYLYSEHGGDKEKALALAKTAKEVLPDDARVSDTLGWILYKRGIYERALSLLTESATKLGDNPEAQYHLGMTQYKLGNHDAAKEAFTRALKLNASFPGADEAKRTLAQIE